MRLSAIRLAGFKSFVEPTLIPIPGNRVGIVGPNGCGKSNLIDAVRWVMGESTASHLRGDALADVIFNGSGQRAPIAQASIELHFDNSAGRLEGPWGRYREIVVRRVLTRDGQSQYFLNATRCRRRDVTDLFLGTGLGPRSYAIIEQGMISRLIEARPEELRTLVEEAAGVSRYRERRRETETRISQTRDNLARLTDLREEMGRQLQILARQAQGARQFLTLRERQQALEIQLAAWRWRQRQQELASLQEALARQQSARADLEAALAQGEAEQARRAEQRSAGAQAFETLQQRHFAAGGQLARLEQQRSHLQESAVREAAERDQLKARLLTLAQEREATQALEQRAQAEAAQLAPALARQQGLREAAGAALKEQDAVLIQAAAALEQARAAWESLRRQQTGAQARREQLAHRLADSTRRLARLQAESLPDAQALDAAVAQAGRAQEQAQSQESAARDALEAATAACAAERKAEQVARRALDAQRGAWQRLQGQVSALESLRRRASAPTSSGQSTPPDARPLIEQMDVAPGWERAVETVLREWLGALALPDPLSQLAPDANPAGPALAWVDAAQPPGACPGDRLGAQVRGAGALAARLDRVHLAPDLAAARAQVAQLPAHESVITPEGWWLGPGWLRGGRAGEAGREGVLLREREWRAAQAEAAALEVQVRAAEAQHAEIHRGLTGMEAARQGAETALRAAQQTHGAARHALDRARLAATQAAEQAARRQREEAEIEAQRAPLAEALEQAQAELAALAARIAECQLELEARSQARATAGEHRDSLARERAALDRRHHELALQQERALGDTRAQGLRRGPLEAESAQVGARLAVLEAQAAARGAPLQVLETALAAARAERDQIDGELRAARGTLETLDQALQAQHLQAQALAQQLKSQGAELEALSLRHREAQLRCEDLTAWLIQQGEYPATAAARLSERDTETTLAAELTTVTQRIERMGAVNLAAVADHAELSDRIAGLASQDADLTEALDTLEVAMRRMDRETRALFAETFERLNGVFQTTFPKLFGGGEARLELEGDGNLLPGIRVIARPPGKRNSSIHLLSGGEKALTAVALVFAIFELNPAPFCMLDEVDAPLDEANVGRFCDLVQEMAERVQCIFVTHNKTTMTAAEHLIGITMQEPGVSRVVTVDLERATALVAQTP